MISGFSFIHNGIKGGYPFVEAIQAVRPYVNEICIVDMQSNDGTREVLEQLDVTIIKGEWGNQAGLTLAKAHSLYTQCKGDMIVHFEADEVYEDSLIREISTLLKAGEVNHFAVWRLQVEQNFQRIRWYPELVHRVFPKDSGVIKEGHTTNLHREAITLPVQHGFLWDCTNCFRDNYLDRIIQQSELWGSVLNLTFTPLHTNHSSQIYFQELERELQDERWAWKTTPLKIPDILQNLVGMTQYKPRLD